MRSIVSRFFCLIACLLLFVDAAAQQEEPKDARAVAVLGQMAAATGWSRLNLPADAVATGTVTRYQAKTPDTIGIVLKAKGPRQYRTEIREVTSLTTAIVNGDRAAVLTPDGIKWIPPHAALSLRPLVFPFLTDLVRSSDTNVTLRYLGMDIVRGEATHQIQVIPAVDPEDTLGESRTVAAPMNVWIAAATGLPVKMGYVTVAHNAPSSGLFVTRFLSDFRRVGGLVVPFRQEEFAGDTRVFDLRLSAVQLNTGLPDAEFALPDAETEEK